LGFSEAQTATSPSPADLGTHALLANAANGLRRSNADKRRCVEIALKEFGKLSSRAIAELCGVSHPFVDGLRDVETVSTSTRVDTMGRNQPAHKSTPKKPSIFAPDAPEADGRAFIRPCQPSPV